MKNRPNQTLRQYLDEKYYAEGPLRLVTIIAVVALPGLAGVWIKNHAPNLWWLVLPMFPVCVWLSAHLVWLRRCPRCRKPLGEIAGMHWSVEGSSRRSDPIGDRYRLEQLGGCPRCGLKLDERILPG